MTNNLDDFEQQDMPPEPPGKPGVGANLSNAWRSQPLFKLFVLMVVVGAIVAVGVSFFSSGNNRNTAGLVKPPDLNEAPGGKASPYMKEQTELANSNRTQDAIKNGNSAMPTPIGQADPNDMNANSSKNEQLNELRAEVETMNKQLQQQKQQQNPQVQQQLQQQQIQQEQYDDSLAQAMQHQMTQLTDSWVPKGVKQVEVTKIEDVKKAEAEAAKEAQQAQQQDRATPKTIVPAGTVSYAQLITEANSDVPGPILAEIVSGPLAGARAVGQFQVANGNADYLVLQFNLANLKGKDYAINAVALDPDTTLGGMATEVNQRYFTRVILPAAAGFLQGFGSALGQGDSSISTNGTTTIVSQSGKGISQGAFTGVGQAAQTASQFFQNQANQTRPLVRVASGTPLGMFFTSTVTDQQAQEGQLMTPVGGGYGQGQAGYGQQQNNGYPATTVGYFGQNQQGAYGQQQQNIPYPNYSNTGYGNNVMGSAYGSNVNVNPSYNTGATNSSLMTPAYPANSVYYTH